MSVEYSASIRIGGSVVNVSSGPVVVWLSESVATTL